MRAPRLRGLVRVRREVLEGRVRDAVSLEDVALRLLYGEETGDWTGDPWAFLERTYVTRGMRRAVLTVYAGLASKTLIKAGDMEEHASRVVVLPSLLGGGKTHLLAFLVYSLQVLKEQGPQVLRRVDPVVAGAARELAEAIDPRRIRLAIIAGDTERLAPRPTQPVRGPGGWEARTLWGYMLGLLGVPRELWARYDENLEVPGKDALRDMIGDEPALIIIDEITSYASSLPGDAREQIVTFLKNLFEAANNLPRTVVVISLPAEVREETVERVEHRVTVGSGAPIDLTVQVYSMAQRVPHKVIPPVDMRADIPFILRRRLLENSDEELSQAAQIIVGIMRRYGGEELERAARELQYGSLDRFLAVVAETFPFHPLYIKTLQDIGTNVPGFRRTRSLVQISAAILRRIDRLESSMVMPWHLDPEDESLRSEVLLGHDKRDYYTRVILSDLEALKELYSEDPERTALAKRVISVVLLYSVALGMLANIQQMIQSAPSRDALPAYIVEPAMIEQGVRPAEVLNIVEDLVSSGRLQLTEIEGKILYPIIPDINSLIRHHYTNTGLDALYKQLERIASLMESATGERLKKIVVVHRASPATIDNLRSHLDRLEEPTLVVLLDPAANPEGLARMLPRNNTFLLASDFSIRLDSEATSPAVRAIASKTKKQHPFIDWPETLGRLAELIARILLAIQRARDDARHAGYEEALQKVVLEKLSRTEKVLREDFNQVVVASLRLLWAGVGGKEHHRIASPEVLLSAYTPGASQLRVAPALEAYMRSQLGYPDKIDHRLLLEVASILNRTGTEKILGEETVIINSPLPVSDLWNYLLTSKDQRVPPHLLTPEAIAEGLHRVYNDTSAPGSPSKIAFLVRRGEKGLAVVWLKPLSLEEAPSCVAGMIRRFYDSWASIASTLAREARLPRGGLEAIMRASIAHPSIVVEEYVQGILRLEKPVRREGEDVVRRHFLVDCAGLAAGEGRREELSKVYGALRGNRLRLYEKLVGGYIAYEEHVVEKSYEAEAELESEEVVVEAGSDAVLRGVVRLRSEDYPAKIEVIARVEDADTGRTVREKTWIANARGSPRIDEVVSIEVPLPREPGRYRLEVYTKGLYPKDYQEIHRATARISILGERCASITTELASLDNAIGDADRWKPISIEISLGPEAPRHVYLGGLRDAIRETRRLAPTATYTLQAKAHHGKGRISVSLEKVDSKTAGMMLNTLSNLLTASQRPPDLIMLTIEIPNDLPDEATTRLIGAYKARKDLAPYTRITIEKCYRLK